MEMECAIDDDEDDDDDCFLGIASSRPVANKEMPPPTARPPTFDPTDPTSPTTMKYFSQMSPEDDAIVTAIEEETATLAAKEVAGRRLAAEEVSRKAVEEEAKNRAASQALAARVAAEYRQDRDFGSKIN